ncbi:S9 family peptidase [Sphingomicrobium sediminis]|uniref:S9 family peptidase n=1 Tax=Sphingomicrobium sediminis TaxID=2950949 RepID=A0A9X2J3E6_9SPHN|nr:S9 family peptidase [Sphingomicrobium sediminis]MCM8557980.1 S9 family peptidase [Sphingomicrobium sediminis]
MKLKSFKLAAASAIGAMIVASPALARPMTPEDVSKIESIGAVAVSPTGEHVAYQVGGTPDVASGEKNGGYSATLMVATAPGEARAYLPEGMSAGGVAFSPDGSMISFTHREPGGDTAVYAMPVDGGAWKKIAGVDGAGVRSYAWSPDGSRIYMLVGADEDKQRAKEAKAGFNAIVYEEEARLNRMFVANVGDEMDAMPTEISVPGYVSAFDISDNGRFAIIDTAPTPNVDDSYTSKRVNIVDLATGNVTAVVATPGKIGDVEISPDGSQLSLIAGVDMNDPAATTLHLVNVADGTFRALNAGDPEAAVDAEWLGNGDLAVVIHQGVDSLLRVYNEDGSVDAEYDPGNLILSSVDAEGGALVVRASSPRHPTELFSVSDGRFTRWTNSNPWLTDITFGEQRAYTYTARDGQQIEGVLIEPVGGFAPGGSPLIMDVHGGPEAHESNGWVTNYSGPGQVAAGQGYAVFLPNYRGSTAYGTAFSKQHQNDYAGKEFNDLVDAKRAMVAEGLIDGDRVGITGGSYGGYASAWAATAQSEEWAASVMFVGISNQISKFGTTDIPYEMYNVHSRKWPWDDWEGMLEVSPITYAGQADTPILIMHGEEDTRVAPSQSYELYRNIKVRTDTPVRLVLYPGEGHGNRLAASQYDYNLRMMRWFDTYLKTGDRDAPLPPSRVELADGAVD